MNECPINFGRHFGGKKQHFTLEKTEAQRREIILKLNKDFIGITYFRQSNKYGSQDMAAWTLQTFWSPCVLLHAVLMGLCVGG